MHYHRVGTSDIQVSEVGFGCMSLEGDQDSTTRLLRKAYEGGITYFDTADLYDKGHNEEMVGEALKPIREKVVLATKVGNVWKEDGSGWEWNPTKKLILEGVDKSLQRLQTDYIDVYQLHGGTIEDPIDELIEAFEQLKKAGKIRSYGISSIRPNVIRRWVQDSNIDSVMMQYSLLDRRPEESCLELLHKNNISVLARGTLAKGQLIDKPAKETLGYSREQVQRLQQALQKTQHPLSASIGYVLKHPAVQSAVVGIRTLAQLKEVLQRSVSDHNGEIAAHLSGILKPNFYTQHR